MGQVTLTANFDNEGDEAAFLADLVDFVGKHPAVSGSWSGTFTASHPDLTSVSADAVGKATPEPGTVTTGTTGVDQSPPA